MIVKNLTKSTSNGRNEVEFKIALNNKQVKDLTSLFKKKVQVMKECSRPAYFNDDITVDIILDDQIFDICVFFYKPDDEAPMIMGEMKVKKKKSADPMSLFIAESWNFLRDPYDSQQIFFEMRDVNIPIMQELKRREDLIDDLNKEFNSFFMSIEQDLGIPGLAKSIGEMDLLEFEYFTDSLFNGDEMLLRV